MPQQSDSSGKGRSRISRSDFLRGAASISLAAGLSSVASPASAQYAPPASADEASPKPATDATRKVNAVYRQRLPFDDTHDFDDARRGLLGSLPEPVIIRNSRGVPVWDMTDFSFVKVTEKDDAPDTVNPSLWRMAKLNMIHGLFEVTDNIWQVRGYDLSVMSIIRSNTGYIVIDPFISQEVSDAVWQQLVIPKLGDKPVVAVIYTHSHVDHYGGVRTFVSDADLAAGKVKVLAPADFTRAAVSENVIAGNAMGRRASYMYGNLVGKNPEGVVDAGLGKTTSSGTIGLALPTQFASKTGETIELDGIELDVIMAPESEAPAEFMFYLPKYKALCAAEDVTHTLHNLYTLRGAKIRDGLLWSKYLQSALDMFGDKTEVLFSSHHWPTWSNERIVAFLKTQRDMYRYLHDQTMHMANSGLTPREIADRMRLPDSLATQWACRSYYGTVYHDSEAQYNLRLGFFDGVPANLYRLPPVDSSRRYVAFMGGADNVLRQARQSYAKGDYRWVSEVVNHVVFADPDNLPAKYLLADAYEQLGYQSEAGPWRDFYLTGALELRRGVTKLPVPDVASPDTIRAMPVEMFFDYLGVRLNGDRAAGLALTFNLQLTDTGEEYILGLENSALHYSKGRAVSQADASVVMTRDALNDVMLGTATMEKQIVAGKAQLTGDPQKLAAFISCLDEFEFWFNIVTP